MEKRVAAHLFLLVVLVSACAGTAAVTTTDVSRSGHIATTTQGSPGSVFFVTNRIGWVVTIPPDRVNTVFFRTVDGGDHWQLWGLGPMLGRPLGFTTDEVLFQAGGCPAHCNEPGVIRSRDGIHWSFAPTPTSDTPYFLPDLQHGWIYGFVPEPPCQSCVPTGKGGPPGPPPVSAVWYTADGGASWREQMRATMGDTPGQVSFWNATNGLIIRQLPDSTASLLLTHDAGVTWQPLVLKLPPPIYGRKSVTAGAPTMFDTMHGILVLTVSDYSAPDVHYVSRTSDGGLTWSTPQSLQACGTPCGGQLYFLDGRRWLAVADHVVVSPDAGATWKQAATAIQAKNVSDVEVLAAAPGTVVILGAGVVASITTDWGEHWRALGLPQIYQSYTGINGMGGWPFCCV